MRKNRSWILVLVMLFAFALPAIAQDDEDAVEEMRTFDNDCSSASINLQVDQWYNEYFAARGEFEPEQAIGAAETFATDIADLTAFCIAEAAAGPPPEVEQTGIGSFDDPFIIQAPGIVGDSTLNITQNIIPADELVIEEGLITAEAIPEDQEVLLLTVTLSCRQGSTTGCNVTPDAFRAYGDMGTLYMPALSQIDDYFPTSRPVNGGSEREGVLPFFVNANDTSLRLAFFPNGDALTDGAFAVYFDATGAANAFEVQSTTPELLIRQRPVTGGAVAVLRTGQVATALGRNLDTTWIYIEAPEGEGWVSIEFLESDGNYESLSVRQPE